VKVVIHPQSIVHSMVVCRDASVLAQLGTPDMRVPIAYGLSWPARIESGASQLDFLSLKPLTFEPADPERFPGLQLAWAALEGPPGSTAVLNAANEIAVEAFLAHRLRFDQIHAVNAETLARSSVPNDATASVAGLLDLDQSARRLALELVGRLGL
jgi:1-deoxy-D-xylulose-5-phosphate reductoisomerase